MSTLFIVVGGLILGVCMGLIAHDITEKQNHMQVLQDDLDKLHQEYRTGPHARKAIVKDTFEFPASRILKV